MSIILREQLFILVLQNKAITYPLYKTEKIQMENGSNLMTIQLENLIQQTFLMKHSEETTTHS